MTVLPHATGSVAAQPQVHRGGRGPGRRHQLRRHEILKTFSEHMKISFPLLSDPKSKTIEDYHIKNPAAKGKAEGVPYPGTFVIDAGGVIRKAVP